MLPPTAWNIGSLMQSSAFGRSDVMTATMAGSLRGTAGPKEEGKSEAAKSQMQDASRAGEQIRQLYTVAADNARKMVETVIKEQEREASAYENSIQRKINAEKKAEEQQARSPTSAAGSRPNRPRKGRISTAGVPTASRSSISRNKRGASKGSGSRNVKGWKGRIGGLASGMGQSALSMMPRVGLLGFAQGAVQFGTEMHDQAHKVSASARESEIVDVTSRGQARVQNAQAEAEAIQAKQGVMVDFSQFNSFQHLPQDRATESKIREAEARTDLTPQQKAQFRQRAEEDNGFNKEHGDLQRQSSDIQSRQGLLDSAMSQAMERKKVIEEARDSSLNVFSAKKKEVQANPDWMGGHSNAQQQEMDSLDGQAAQKKLESAAQLKQVQEEMRQIDEQRIALAEQKVAVDQKALGVTRAQKQKAYEDVRDHKQGMRQDSIRIGMMSPAERGRMKMIDQMISRIKEQKRRKAAGENVTVEKMPFADMQFAVERGMGTQTVHEQAIENEREMNLQNKDRSEDQLKEKEEHLAKLEASPQEKEDEQNLSGSMDQLKNASASAMKSIDGVLEITKIVNGLEAALKQVEAELRAKEATRGSLVSYFL